MAELTVGKGDQHVRESRGDTDIPQHRTGAIRELIEGRFAEGEINDSVTLLLKRLEHFVTDSSGHHVDHHICRTVVSGNGIKEMKWPASPGA